MPDYPPNDDKFLLAQMFYALPPKAYHNGREIIEVEYIGNGRCSFVYVDTQQIGEAPKCEITLG